MFKKIIFTVVLLGIAVTAYAFKPSESVDKSSLLSDDGTFTDVAGYLYGVSCASGGDAWRMGLYDTALAATSEEATLFPIHDIVATQELLNLWFSTPINYDNGVYLDALTATPEGCILYYRSR